jgi:hypothetical protein
LQISAEQDDVLSVLRKTKRLSSKLGRKDITEWVEQELNGYKDINSVPNYRIVGVSLAYNTNGYIPAGYNMVCNGIMPIPDSISLNLTCPVAVPISTVMSWIKELGTKKGLYLPMGKEQSDMVRSLFSCTMSEIIDQLTFLSQMNQSNIDDIPEQVKNKVLDWACSEAVRLQGRLEQLQDCGC